MSCGSTTSGTLFQTNLANANYVAADANGVLIKGTGSVVGETITGDVGGAISPSSGNWNLKATSSAGSSISFSGSGSTLTLNDTDANDNIIIGAGAGNGTLSGSENTGVGRVVFSSLTNGGANTAFGWSAMQHATTDLYNCGFGAQALQTLVGSVGHNTGIGTASLNAITTGRDNTCLGYLSGGAYTSSESSNIIIGSSVQGTAGESNTIRIGTQGSGTAAQNRCFIAGIEGVTVSNLNVVTINTSTGQLGSQAAANVGTVTQFDVLVGGSGGAIASVGPGSAGQVLQSGGNAANPVYSTATYPLTTTANDILYSSSSNVVGQITTANNGVLITSASGVPSLLAAGTTGQVLTATTGSPATWAAPATSGTVTSVSGTANQVAVATGTTTPVISLIGPYTPSTYGAHTVIVGEGTSSMVGIGPGSSGQVFQSGGASADPAYSTATYPATTTINQILYSSSANTIAGLATANGGVFDTTSSGVPQVDTTNFSVLSTGVQVKGNNTNTAPPAGFIGENIRSFVPQASAVSVSNASPTNITSISLTAGVWDISAIACLTGTLTATYNFVAISPSSATLPATTSYGDNVVMTPYPPNATCNQALTIPAYRVTIASTTPYYLVVQVGYTVGTCTGYGRLSATRVG